MSRAKARHDDRPVPARRRVTGRDEGPRGVWSRQPAGSLALVLVATVGLSSVSGAAPAQEHRAEQQREITYWLQEPSTHSFRISHDFTVDTPGQRYVHNFVRAGSQVSGSSFYDLNTGERLDSHEVTGAEVNALEMYPYEVEPDSVAIQAELAEPIAPGHSVRIRVVETYTDPERYYLDGDELVWDRTLGRPYNVVTLPPGWMLTSVSVPAVIEQDEDGRIALRFINPRPDSLHVVIRARPRPEPEISLARSPRRRLVLAVG